MIGSYQVTGVAKFAKQMEEEGRVGVGRQLLLEMVAVNTAGDAARVKLF